ncbi:MAG: FliI/YscN family ATPase [Myxococcales bacterium]|nr:FliI/YscN family ATPase [Myxococcales bacterium]
MRAAAEHEAATHASASSRSDAARAATAPTPHGSVSEAVGLVLRAELADAALGEIVKIARLGGPPMLAEVVGFRDGAAILMPLGDALHLAPRAAVWRTGAPMQFPCGPSLLGRVINGLGDAIDGGPPIDEPLWAVSRAAPPALARAPITQRLATGIRAIDSCVALGEGQRIGLFAGAGHGKSTLLAQLASTGDEQELGADVVVLCLVGERGREVREFTDRVLAHARHRTIVVCATSDAPSLVRVRAAEVATATAEWFRDRGKRVLLLVDSITRVARAQREVGLAAGEPPTRHGYPPSVFSVLPRLIERAGPAAVGSITAIYTVLVAGGDFDEPIADEVRSLLDGHIVLDPRLFTRGHFPAISLIQSVSRVMASVVTPEHAAAAASLRQLLAIYEEHRDLIAMGAIVPGQNPTLDRALARMPQIDAFLQQPLAGSTPPPPSNLPHLLAALKSLVGPPGLHDMTTRGIPPVG